MDKKSLELQITVTAEQAVKTVSSLSAEFKKLKEGAGSLGVNCKDAESTIAQLEKQTTRTAQSLKLFGANTADVRTAQAALKSGILDLVEHGLSPESGEVQKLVGEYKKLEKQSDELDRENGGLLSSFSNLKNEIGSLAAVAAAVKFDQAAAGAIDFSLACADSFQNARNDFGVLLGDMQAGAALFDTIIKPFNDFTPFDLETTQQATKVLLAAKVPIADLTTWLTKLGNLSQGNAQKMLSFSNAFNKAAAKGKADMEVLNVYIDQGVPILDELAKGFNTTGAEITKMASEGKISFEALSDALSRLTAEGGLYFGGIDLSSRSFAAMKEGLSESVKSLAASFGALFLPVAIKVVEALTNITNAINDSPIAKGILTAAVVALTAAVNIFALKALVGFITKTWKSFAAQMSLNASIGVLNAVVLAATVAVAALAAGYVVYASQQQKAVDATNDQALALKGADQAAKDYMKSIASMNNAQASVELGNYRESDLQQMKQQLSAARTSLESAKKTPTIQVDNGFWKGISEEANPDIEFYEQRVTELENRIAVFQERKQAIYDTMKANNRAMQEKAFNAEKEADQKINARYNELYDRTRMMEEQKLKDDLAFLKGLRNKQTLDETSTDATQKSGFNSAKLEASIGTAQKALDDFYAQNKGKEEQLKILPEFKSDWVSKQLSGLDTIYAERAKAQTELAAKAKASFESGYMMEAAYIEENAALNFYYAEKEADYKAQLAEEERQRVLNAHQNMLDSIREEYAYRAELAREQINTGSGNTLNNYGSYAANTALSAVSSSEAGTLLAAIQGGSSPWAALIGILIQAVAQLDCFNEALNFVTYFVQKVFTPLDEAFSLSIQPIMDILDDLAEVISDILPIFTAIAQLTNSLISLGLKMLLPVLKALGNVFEWLYKSVIRPVGNAIINVMNAVIGALNMIPFVNIKKLSLLPAVGEATEDAAASASDAADAASEWAAKIKAMYQAQIDEINELLRYQIQSLQSQYELGLISRSEYIEQKDAYKAAAEKDILAVENEMNATLAQIEANTYAALDAQQAQTVAESRTEYAQSSSYAQQWGAVVPVVGHIAGGIVDTVVNVAQGIGNWAKGLFGFDVGTSYIPCDMPALVHEGEGIIPKTFNEAIQSGDYALVGSKNRSTDDTHGGGTFINVTVNVEGSVIKKNDLIAEIYSGIASYIEGGAAPLPA